VRISGSYTLPVTLERAYEILQDPVELQRAIPGCESLEKIGPDEYRMKMKLVLAALAGQFEGKVRIADPAPPTSFRLVVEGSGRIGFIRGEGLLKFSPLGGDTEVSYDGEAQVGGTLAAVGQRLIDGTSKMIVKKFFDNLAEGMK